MRLYGLIGFPLSHSFSKRYFTDKFLREGLRDCRYQLFPIEKVEAVRGIIADHPALQGFNVTIPHKRTIIDLLDHSSLPEGLDACNCVRVHEGKLWGFNTDHTGFRKSLEPLLTPKHKKALVLGNGGATKAVLYVLRQLGVEAEVVSRKAHEGSTFTHEALDEELMREHLLIINTSPVGMYPLVNDCPPIPYEGLGKDHILFDLVYNPEKTLFVQKGEARGAKTRNGLEMLEIQAEESWKIWTNTSFP